MSKGKDTTKSDQLIVAHRKNSHAEECNQLSLPEFSDALIQTGARYEVHNKRKGHKQHNDD